MSVFHIDSSSISSTSLIDSEITEVKFETAENFDLNFFDTPDDSLTQVAFSNPNSVESSTPPTPEPAAITQQLPIIKNGKRETTLEELLPYALHARCKNSGLECA